jgi:predicted acylesterase/phospholipase RssA
MKILSLISVVFAQNFTAVEDDGFCRILALRGGGTNGAFEIGILKKMVEYLDPIDYAYDVFQGVSIGGINAAAMATF